MNQFTLASRNSTEFTTTGWQFTHVLDKFSLKPYYSDYEIINQNCSCIIMSSVYKYEINHKQNISSYHHIIISYHHIYSMFVTCTSQCTPGLGDDAHLLRWFTMVMFHSNLSKLLSYQRVSDNYITLQLQIEPINS